MLSLGVIMDDCFCPLNDLFQQTTLPSILGQIHATFIIIKTSLLGNE